MSASVSTYEISDMAALQLNGTETDYSHPIFSSAHFMMYCYKVMPCMKSYRHDWRVCPYAHVGETAARRHPRLHSYVGVICPETKKGEKCPRGDSCPCTHSLFEYWLHPTRFKTEFCSRGSSCSRSFCFFAHSEVELRVFDTSVLSSPMARKALSIAEGNDCSRAHYHNCSDAPLIKQPFGALDVGNMCGMSTLGNALSATTRPSTGRTAPHATLWDRCATGSNFESGQTSSPASEIDSIQPNKLSWPDFSRQALNEYFSFEALTALSMLLPPSDK